MEASTGFAPVARHDARVLILGSLPGRRSLEAGEYYAHPHNAFWPIMASIFAVTGNYHQRCHGLRENRIALWDVLRRSVRPGSLDAEIRLDSAEANDFSGFFAEHPGLRLVACNGAKAEQLYRRFVLKAGAGIDLPCVRLPSTSPAYASMPFSVKLEAWRAVLDGLR
ncbi:MAG TPA: DNA-deoxyinosine glycosylase [Woeseiaceae bacterium]